MNKKILLLTTPFRPNIGGVETHLDDLVLEGNKQKIKFIILTYQPLVTKATGKTIEKTEGAIIFRIPWIRLNLFLKLESFPLLEFIYLFPGLFLGGFILLLVAKPQIKIIHAQGLVAGAVGVFLGKMFGLPVIISTHSIYNFPKFGLYRKFAKYLMNSCKNILTLSQQSKKEIVGLGIDSNKVNTFTYWINQTVFSPQDKKHSRALLNLPKDRFICLFVGRLVEVKGIKELLDAASLTNRKIVFIIVGDGPLKDDIKAVAARNKNIIFAGKIENKNLPVYYSAADVLIMPSTHEEGFGRVILEALACGLTVIASDRGGIKESLNEQVGIFINITPENIKQSLEKCLNNPEKLKDLANHAVDFAKQRYNKKNSRMIFKYYE